MRFFMPDLRRRQRRGKAMFGQLLTRKNPPLAGSTLIQVGDQPAPTLNLKRLNSLDIRRLFSLRTIHDVKANTLPFLQGLEALHVDSREVGKQIFTTFVRGDEPEALSVVKPFDDTSCHFTSLHKQAGEAEQQKLNVCHFAIQLSQAPACISTQPMQKRQVIS